MVVCYYADKWIAVRSPARSTPVDEMGRHVASPLDAHDREMVDKGYCDDGAVGASYSDQHGSREVIRRLHSSSAADMVSQDASQQHFLAVVWSLCFPW